MAHSFFQSIQDGLKMQPRDTKITAGLGSWFARDEANDKGRKTEKDFQEIQSIQSSITDSYCPRPAPRYPPPPSRGLFQKPARPEDMVIAVTMKETAGKDDDPTDPTEESTERERPRLANFTEVSGLESLGMSATDNDFQKDDFLSKFETQAQIGESGCGNEPAQVVFKGWDATPNAATSVEDKKKPPAASWWGVGKKEEPQAPVLAFVPPQSIEDAIKELQMLEGIRVKCLDESSRQSFKFETTSQIDKVLEEELRNNPPPDRAQDKGESSGASSDANGGNATRIVKKGWLFGSLVDPPEPPQESASATSQDDPAPAGLFKKTARKKKGSSWWGTTNTNNDDDDDDCRSVELMMELLDDDHGAAEAKARDQELLQTKHMVDPSENSQEIKSGWLFSTGDNPESPRPTQPATLNLGSMRKAISRLDSMEDSLGDIVDKRDSFDSIERELNQIEVDSAKILDSANLSAGKLQASFKSPLKNKGMKKFEPRVTVPGDVEPQSMRRSKTAPSSGTKAPWNETQSEHIKRSNVASVSFGEMSNSDTIDRYMQDNPISLSDHKRSTTKPSSRRSSTGASATKGVNFHANTRRASTSNTLEEMNLIAANSLSSAAPETDSPGSSKFLSWGFLKNLTKEQVAPQKRLSTSSSFGGLLRPPPNRDFTMSLRKGTLLESKEELDMRFKWNQQLLSITFAPYRKMFAQEDDLIPTDDEYYAVKEAREANEEKYSEIRDLMLENGEITEREIAAFFDAFALCTVKTQSLTSQVIGLKAVRRAEDQEKTLRQSVARSAAMNKLMKDSNTSADVKLLLRHLETAESKAKDIEAQLNELGVILEDIKTEEEDEIYLEWERAHEAENLEALKRIRRHMPVNVKSATEAQLYSETTPNGKVLPKRFAKKFKTTNVLQLIRMGPGDIERMHPSTLENLCMANLTLTESRALHSHLRPVGERWKESRKDDLDERRYIWYTMMKQNFKESLDRYLQHVEQYGPPGNHPYSTRINANGGCPFIGKQCPLKADKMLEYNYDYGYPDGPYYDELGSIKTENEMARAKAQATAEAVIEERADDRRESFEAHYARFENSSTSILLANASCEAMDYAMDRMEFLQVRWIKMRILSEKNGASPEEQARNEIMGFTEALQNVSLAVAQASERSGMSLTGARMANNKKPDFRGDIECGLAEELCETADTFLTGIEERLSSSKAKDEVLAAYIAHLRVLLGDLHQRNVDTLSKLGARRPPRSRKVRTREEIETKINTKLNAQIKRQHELDAIAPPPLTETRPPSANTSSDSRGPFAARRALVGNGADRAANTTRSAAVSTETNTTRESSRVSKPSYTSQTKSTARTALPKTGVTGLLVASTTTTSPRVAGAKTIGVNASGTSTTTSSPLVPEEKANGVNAPRTSASLRASAVPRVSTTSSQVTSISPTPLSTSISASIARMSSTTTSPRVAEKKSNEVNAPGTSASPRASRVSTISSQVTATSPTPTSTPLSTSTSFARTSTTATSPLVAEKKTNDVNAPGTSASPRESAASRVLTISSQVTATSPTPTPLSTSSARTSITKPGDATIPTTTSPRPSTAHATLGTSSTTSPRLSTTRASTELQSAVEKSAAAAVPSTTSRSPRLSITRASTEMPAAVEKAVPSISPTTSRSSGSGEPPIITEPATNAIPKTSSRLEQLTTSPRPAVSSAPPIETKKRESIEEIKARIAARRSSRVTGGS